MKAVRYSFFLKTYLCLCVGLFFASIAQATPDSLDVWQKTVIEAGVRKMERLLAYNEARKKANLPCNSFLRLVHKIPSFFSTP